MRRSRYKDKPNDEVSIDLTSMMDVIFILLIFFIVATTFDKSKSIELSKIESFYGTKSDEINRMDISILSTNKLWFEGEELEVSTLEDKLKNSHLLKEKISVHIFADKMSNSSALVNVIGAVKKSGFSNIQLETKAVENK